MSEWQPVETAPKDGGYIIAGSFRNGDELCWVKHSRWITSDEIAEIEGYDSEDWEPGWTNGNDESEICFPTHWQPLPTPPKEADCG